MEKNEITYLIISGTIVFLVLLIFVVGIILILYRKNRMYHENLIELEHQKEQEVLRSQLEIQEQTLKNISQEIHDNIGQVLSLAKLNISTMNVDEPHQLKEKISDSKQLVSKAIQDLRGLSKILDSDFVIEKGLLNSIEYELDLVSKTGIYLAEMQTSGVPYRLTQQKELILFRVFQEVVNNVIKHAKATKIRAELSYDANSFSMIISDDGVGFDMANPGTSSDIQSGSGIRNMRNRTMLIGADFDVTSAATGGTVVKIRLPVSLTERA